MARDMELRQVIADEVRSGDRHHCAVTAMRSMPVVSPHRECSTTSRRLTPISRIASPPQARSESDLSEPALNMS
jgi:hypothetical protein